MSENRLENLKTQFALQMQAARNAGIYDYTFLAFGSLLGYVRERGFIDHDNDMDLGVLADKLTAKQINAYIEELYKPTKHPKGLFAYRGLFALNKVNGKHFWASLMMRPKGTCYKCCNWFMFEHKGYIYHHKGEGTRVKGLPARYTEIGPEVEYLGTKIHIPKYSGACLDFWYPDWITSRSDVSKSEGRLLKVKSWSEPNNWELIK